MKTWTDDLIDGAYHVIGGYDGSRGKLYLECGMIVEGISVKRLGTRTMTPIIFATDYETEAEAQKQFDKYCKFCMRPGATQWLF